MAGPVGDDVKKRSSHSLVIDDRCSSQSGILLQQDLQLIDISGLNGRNECGGARIIGGQINHASVILTHNAWRS